MLPVLEVKTTAAALACFAAERALSPALTWGGEAKGGAGMAVQVGRAITVGVHCCTGTTFVNVKRQALALRREGLEASVSATPTSPADPDQPLLPPTVPDHPPTNRTPS